MSKLYLIYVVGIFVMCTVVNGQTTDGETSTDTPPPGAGAGSSPSPVCQLDPRDAGPKLRSLDDAFGQSEVTDVVLLIEKSGSITDKTFATTKDTTTTLMDYLVDARRLYLHEDYTRVAVVSFGVSGLVEFNGISNDSDTVHACNVNDKLRDLEGPTEEATNLEAALTVSATSY